MKNDDNNCNKFCCKAVKSLGKRLLLLLLLYLEKFAIDFITILCMQTLYSVQCTWSELQYHLKSNYGQSEFLCAHSGVWIIFAVHMEWSSCTISQLQWDDFSWKLLKRCNFFFLRMNKHYVDSGVLGFDYTAIVCKCYAMLSLWYPSRWNIC